MKKTITAQEYDLVDVREAMKNSGLKHLRVSRYRASIMLRSGLEEFPVTHCRLTRISTDYWILEFPAGKRWECDPEKGSLQNILKRLLNQYPWCLSPLDE